MRLRQVMFVIVAGLVAGCAVSAANTPRGVSRESTTAVTTSLHLSNGPSATALPPIDNIDNAFLQWQYVDTGECKTAAIGVEQMRYSRCSEALVTASSMSPMSMWPYVNGQSQADYLRQRYAPFTADTIRGSLIFSGTGTVVASEAEQRAIAEWALIRWKEANVGYLSADVGLSLSWHEESSSLCGGLWIYQTGLAVAWNCSGAEAVAVSFLSAAQLQQFYTWLDSGRQWNISRIDQKSDKPGKITLQFPWSAPGEKTTVEDPENVLSFAREAYLRLKDSVTLIPTATPVTTTAVTSQPTSILIPIQPTPDHPFAGGTVSNGPFTFTMFLYKDDSLSPATTIGP